MMALTRVAEQRLKKKILIFSIPRLPAPSLVPLPCRAGTLVKEKVGQAGWSVPRFGRAQGYVQA